MPRVRFAYTTESFPRTVEYWDRHVGLACVKNEHQGLSPESPRIAWFDAGGDAVIEVIESATVRPADGSWIAIQVADVDDLYDRLLDAGLAGRVRPYTDARGERSVLLREPNGVGVLFFTPPET